MLLHDYFDGDWEAIFKIIKNYEAFQDSPFSMATDVFISEIRNQYPNAKFILLTRKNSSEWYHSLVRFHRKIRYGNKEKIEWRDVQKIQYSGRKVDRALLHYHNYDALDPTYKKPPYDQEVLERWYNTYNARIMRYFKNDNNFISINLEDKDSEARIKTFLGKENSAATIEWLNRTKPK